MILQHHTVFFAACPVQTPDQFWKKSMLPMALDALLDVMTTKVDDDRLEKERAAVLSEMSMVNKMVFFFSPSPYVPSPAFLTLTSLFRSTESSVKYWVPFIVRTASPLAFPLARKS